MPTLSRYLLILLLALGSTTLQAQNTAPSGAANVPAPSTEQTLDQLGSQLDTVKAGLNDNSGKVSLSDLRNTAMGIQTQASQLAASLAPKMAALQAQLTVLGPAPAKGAPPEAAEVSKQRRKLNKRSADLDAQIKQAQLLSQDASQLTTQIIGMRNDQFQARLASRTATPLSSSFWTGTLHALPDDIARLRRLGHAMLDAWNEAWQPANRQPLLWCLIAAIVLLGAGRWLLERGMLKIAIRRMPDGHLRRSAMATIVALTAVLTTGLAAQLVYVGVNYHGVLDPDLDALAISIVRRVYFAAFVAGLVRALLSVRRPSWRLPALSDIGARQLRWFPWLLGATTLLLGLIERIGRTIGASLPLTVAIRGVIALVISGLIGIALLRLRRARFEMAASGVEPTHRPLWVGLLAAGATLGVVGSWLSVAAGYIALGYFVAVQMLWVGVVVATLYLLIQLVHDVIDTLLSPQGRTGKRLQTTFELAPSTLEQSAIVLTGISRIGLVLLAMATVLAPFGAGPKDLIASAMRTFSSIKLGQLPIEPGSIFTGLLVLAIGWIALRTLKRWLHEQLLPKTTMEQGMQDSLVTLLGYLGGMLVFVLTLAALHVDLKSIAWIVSALSVGIGFGLQAIVQNFISGLILLAERPVKVGDWISLAGVEGDIRRINVRATEIQLWDRSTMIVPNSQLITQNVRNVTLGRAQGRVHFKLPMPLDTDAARAREIILEVLKAHEATLDSTPPFVLMDSVDANCMTFSAYAYTSSPREANTVKSDLLFAVLERLRAEKMRLIRPQEMRVHTLPADAEAGLDAG
ncbi:MAG: mechanosensitive ion channel family protein [Rhodanobacter sp.]|nr:MAG: mechanosensitive ion channel family protein [Rhodanobacter sp.]